MIFIVEYMSLCRGMLRNLYLCVLVSSHVAHVCRGFVFFLAVIGAVLNKCSWLHRFLWEHKSCEKSQNLQTFLATFLMYACTGYYGSEKMREELKYFCNFWPGTLGFETFAARPPWGEESFVHGTDRIRRRDRLFFIEQRQQASTPFTQHRESTETKLVIPHPVLYAFNRSKEYLSHTLCGINRGRRLSRQNMWSTQQLAHNRQCILIGHVFHLSRGYRVCVWRERVYVRE